jgi:hypothetical protein
VGLSGRDHRHFLMARGGMGDHQPQETRAGLAAPEHGDRDPKAAIRLHSSHRPRFAILCPQQSEDAEEARVQDVDERERQRYDNSPIESFFKSLRAVMA